MSERKHGQTSHLSFCSTFVFVVGSTGVQSFSVSTTTATLTLKNLLDYEATKDYAVYMRITDTTNGWTGNITIGVRKYLDMLSSYMSITNLL